MKKKFFSKKGKLVILACMIATLAIPSTFIYAQDKTVDKDVRATAVTEADLKNKTEDELGKMEADAKAEVEKATAKASDAKKSLDKAQEEADAAAKEVANKGKELNTAFDAEETAKKNADAAANEVADKGKELNAAFDAEAAAKKNADDAAEKVAEKGRALNDAFGTPDEAQAQKAFEDADKAADKADANLKAAKEAANVANSDLEIAKGNLGKISKAHDNVKKDSEQKDNEQKEPEVVKPQISKAPSTGDNSNLVMFAALLAVATGTLTTLAVYKKSRHK